MKEKTYGPKSCAQCGDTKGTMKNERVNGEWKKVEYWTWSSVPKRWGPFCSNACCDAWIADGAKTEVRHLPGIFGSMEIADSLFAAIAQGYYKIDFEPVFFIEDGPPCPCQREHSNLDEARLCTDHAPKLVHLQERSVA